MTVTATGTRIDEVADGIYRIATPVPPSRVPGGFSFNQYLIDDEEPLLFHMGHRRMFPQVSEAVAKVMPLERLRWLSFSHFEADESGALNQFLNAAPKSLPLCGQVAARISINDYADREARQLADGEVIAIGRHRLQWLDMPHMPHAWECGLMMEQTTGTLLCSDLFTEGGADHPAITEGDILGPSEKFRSQSESYSHTVKARPLLKRLAALKPGMLARMHGSAWRGDGSAMLLALADSVGAP
jgi:flavorubredoxin